MVWVGAERIELEGGGQALALTDDNGNVELSEYDEQGNAVQRTYGYLPVRSSGRTSYRPPMAVDVSSVISLFP